MEQANPLWAHFESTLEALGQFASAVEKQVTPTAKIEFVERLQIADALRQMDETIETIQRRLEARNAANADALKAKAEMDEVRALVFVGGSIDGKNAEIRDAQLTLALKGDPDYQSARLRYDAATERVSQADIEIDFLRSVQSALKARCRVIAAQLEYLAG